MQIYGPQIDSRKLHDKMARSHGSILLDILQTRFQTLPMAIPLRGPSDYDEMANHLCRLAFSMTTSVLIVRGTVCLILQMATLNHDFQTRLKMDACMN